MGQMLPIAALILDALSIDVALGPFQEHRGDILEEGVLGGRGRGHKQCLGQGRGFKFQTQGDQALHPNIAGPLCREAFRSQADLLPDELALDMIPNIKADVWLAFEAPFRGVPEIDAEILGLAPITDACWAPHHQGQAYELTIC